MPSSYCRALVIIMESMTRSVTRDDFDRADKIEQFLKIHLTQVVDAWIRTVIVLNVMAIFNSHRCELDRFFLFNLFFPLDLNIME